MKLRYSMTSLLAAVLLVAVGVRGSMFGYATWWVPRQDIPWKEFSAATVDAARTDRRVVLVHFTADWTISIKTVLRFALETPDVRREIYYRAVVPVLANVTDWQSSELEQHIKPLGVKSIPFTVVYPPDESKPPIVLRDSVTEKQILQAIRRAGGRPRSHAN